MSHSISSEEDIIVGAREQLFHLLAEASEIEHTLMCSYLYAAFSLKRPGDPGLDPRQVLMVGEWRKTIMSVAIDEMGHLVNVSNLLVSLGGQAHFSRPNFPVDAGYFPSGVIVRLTPFNMETLDHFIHLERPQGAAGDDAHPFRQEELGERGEAYHGLMPSVQNYKTVGRLYEAIRINLQEQAKRIGEKDLFLGVTAGQVGPAIIDIEGVTLVEDLASALQAIDVIVEQGEGAPGDREGSHYNRFLEIKAQYERELSSNSAFAPAWPGATNPVMRQPPEPEGKVFIDDLNAARVLDFTNAVYGLLVRLLVQAFGRTGSDAVSEQRRFLASAIGLMHLLGTASSALAGMPATPGLTGTTAGMTFTMLRGVERMPPGANEQRVIEERFRELAGAAPGLAQANPQLPRLSEAILAAASTLNPSYIP